MKTLKTFMLLLLVFAVSSFGNNPNGTDDERLIELSGTGIRPHLIDPTPTELLKIEHFCFLNKSYYICRIISSFKL